MIGGIVTAISGLASSYIDGKTAVQKANAEIALKKITARWKQEELGKSQSQPNRPEENPDQVTHFPSLQITPGRVSKEDQ